MWVLWLTHRPPRYSNTRGGFKTAVYDLRVQVHFAGPFDGAGFVVDANRLKDIAVLANRLKHPSTTQETTEVDLFDRAVGEGRTNAVAIERLNSDYLDDVAHGKGSIRSGCSFSTTRRQFLSN